MGSTIYSDGTYRVEVQEDGAILVKPRDWLSKYSAAIHHNLTTLDVFYWPPVRAGGDLTPIVDKNRLQVGDTVIHKPTWDSWKLRRPGVVRPGELIRPGEMDTEEFLRRLHDECGVSGERLTRMSSVLTGTKWRDLNEATALKQLWYLTEQALGGMPGFLDIFKWWVQTLLVLLDAQEKPLRLQGLRAIAYATTAFAFGDPPPVLPWGIEYQLTHGRLRYPLDICRRNWLDMTSKVTTKLVLDVAAKGVDKQVYQTWIQWEANNRRQLDFHLMGEIIRDVSKMLPEDRERFMDPTPIYPNDWPDDKYPTIY